MGLRGNRQDTVAAANDVTRWTDVRSARLVCRGAVQAWALFLFLLRLPISPVLLDLGNRSVSTLYGTTLDANGHKPELPKT